MSLFRVQMYPAGNGDCILVEYGAAAAPHRLLIDGGTPGTAKRLQTALKGLQPAVGKLDLLVVTHVDSDHIGGTLGLFGGFVPGLDFDDIWFNGYRHLSRLEEQGPVQGERLTKELWPRMKQWNKAFGGGPVEVPEAPAALPCKTLPGGMKLTLLSPTRAKLDALRPVWEDACADAELDPARMPRAHPPELEPMGGIDVVTLASTRFKEDDKEPNGSSIAFIAEFGGRSVLFGADAHPTVLAGSIGRLPGGKVSVDAFKLPHHGSRNNVSTDLLDMVETSRYLVSTDGTQFKHPHREAIARVIQRKVPHCELRFNYDKPTTNVWKSLSTKWSYTPVYPASDEDGDRLDL